MFTKSYWMFIAGLALLFAVAIYARSTGLEGFVGSSGPATFHMFGVDWCPHCVSTKPEFESLGSSMTIGGTSVKMEAVNPEREPEKAKGFQIDGYPTLILTKGSQQIKYGGPRTKAGFLQFLQENVA
jgi:thiol-disulfide isomerase/thioredoxin